MIPYSYVFRCSDEVAVTYLNDQLGFVRVVDVQVVDEPGQRDGD